MSGFFDKANNPGVRQRGQLGDFVIVDNTPPVLVSASMTSNNTVTQRWANTGDNIQLNLNMSELVFSPDLTLALSTLGDEAITALAAYVKQV